MKFRFKGVLQESGWISDCVVETDSAGMIASVEQHAENMNCDETVNGYALPGFQNAHSHAFQYAMAGIAEQQAPNNSADDFWSWRSAMYKLANAVDPDEFEAIAAMLYAELLRHGYTQVAEFHYLHHDTSGLPYMSLSEMGHRLISAAERTGIGITLIPVFYQKGGFGKAPLDEQKRFLSGTVDEYLKLYESTKDACSAYDRANIGVGIHSLRAVDSGSVEEIAKNFPKEVPFHIHISEQLKEVAECESHLGKRPVEWMLDNIELSDRFHFVHATHISDTDISGLAHMLVNVVICPTTEGNLGDGLFPLKEFQDRGGHWSIGTDSHVSLNPFEELRLLDYGQRLTTHRRDTFDAGNDCGRGSYALQQAIKTGRRAMGNYEAEYFGIGRPFDALVISADHPLIATASEENLLNTIVYSSDETMHKGTIVNGEWKVRNGIHIRIDEYVRDFVEAVGGLGLR